VRREKERVDAVQATSGITLVLGGTRSGKSEVAERLLESVGGSVTYVATGPAADAARDQGWAARVLAHRARRPGSWATVEVAQGDDLGSLLRRIEDPLVVDSLGTWVAGLEDFGTRDDAPFTSVLEAFTERRDAGRVTVVVSEEVGLGVHPATAIGGEFRDALGMLNRRTADVADRVLLVVAGRVHELAPGESVRSAHDAASARSTGSFGRFSRAPARARSRPWIADARNALGFLTAFGGGGAPDERTLRWFPVVGAAIGAVLGTVWWAATKAWTGAVAAVVVVGLDLVVTGMLHLDGLVDSADGLLPLLDRDRRLEVMRDPGVGAFGAGAATMVLIARWAALTAIAPSVLVLIGLWTASRTTMAVVAVTVPYAREGEGGLAAAFLGATEAGRTAARRSGLLAGAIGVAGALAARVNWGPRAGVVSLAAGVLAASAVVWLARRRIGGFTGDVLGASGIVLETTALVVASAKW
jgi:adenosylcobinamide kinase/adenosylcobinamide-phosphate guanylyltransferase